MFKVTGKQKWGSVYRGGKCIVNFRNGVGYTDNADDAEYLKKIELLDHGGGESPRR